MPLVTCTSCENPFDKPKKRITQTEKLGQQHSCCRKCSSDIANEKRKCEPTTVNATNTRRDKEKFPEKDHARSLVRRAVKTGKLILPDECEFCDETRPVEGHHPDHSKPFLLLYLCKKCHRQADRAIDKWTDLATDYLECV